MSSCRAVITGLGLVSPIGLGVSAFRHSLAAGESGIHRFSLFDSSSLPIWFGGEIEEFEAREFVDRKDRKQLKNMARTSELGVAAARLALDDANLLPGAIEPTRLGVVLGTGIIPGNLADLGPPGILCLEQPGRIDLRKWGLEGLAVIPPMWMLHHVPNMPASHVAILNNAQGPNNTVTQFDAAALFAILEACRILERGAADAMLAGGTDTRAEPISVARGTLYGKLANADDPHKACRPYGRDRKGEVLAEGAGVLLLERPDHARRRGARRLAEVVGHASAFDRGMKGDGLARAITTAMHLAEIGPANLDHVNAAASGSVTDDVWEAQALHRALDGEAVPVLAMKSYLGNAGNGASGLELAASVLALSEGTLPASLNAEDIDPACPVTLNREPRAVVRPYALKVAWTDQGQCAALVIRTVSEG